MSLNAKTFSVSQCKDFQQLLIQRLSATPDPKTFSAQRNAKTLCFLVTVKELLLEDDSSNLKRFEKTFRVVGYGKDKCPESTIQGFDQK